MFSLVVMDAAEAVPRAERPTSASSSGDDDDTEDSSNSPDPDDSSAVPLPPITDIRISQCVCINTRKDWTLPYVTIL